MTTKKTPAKKEDQLPSTDINFAADAGAGLEGADKDSYAVPFLTCLQGLSPQIEELDGAKPGKFCATVTNELFDVVRVIPCAYQRRYLRWAPREEGGGYKGEYLPSEVVSNSIEGMERNDKGQLTVDGDLLKDTRNHFVLYQAASGSWHPAIISLSSTQIKKSKRWMSLIHGIEMRAPNGKTFTPPSFSHIYTLSSVKEENDQGKWYGVKFELDSVVEDGNVYAKAKAFHDSVAAGEVETSQAAQEPVEDEQF